MDKRARPRCWLRRGLILLTVSAALTGMTAHASLQIARQPLFLVPPVEPNIMFTIDDSGSMHFEITPDEHQEQNYYVFPRASSIYGGGDYSNIVPVFDAGDALGARMRSAAYNTTYYNPAIRYRPWIRADGTAYPDAVPEEAYHNPAATDRGSRDLTTATEATAFWRDENGWISVRGRFVESSSRSFFPAVHYRYSGGDMGSYANYERVEIKSGNAPFAGGPGRSDCGDSDACTYTEEITNFANWYSYHRSRILAARAGIGRAFSEQGGNIRVGFGAINQESSGVDDVDTETVIRGVRPFSGDDRDEFYQLLYESDIPAMGTPLRRAAKDVGNYFSRSDNRGPWGAVPGANNGTAHLECRRSYHILMTDGYWSGPDQDLGNVDGSDGDEIAGPNGRYQYTAAPPFEDDHSDTLADAGMQYWKTDLRADLDNRVPTTRDNPAFWQHLVTLGVGLGVTGSVDPEDAFDAIETGATIDWPDPGDSNPAKIDDLLHAAVNSRGGFFSAADPDAFARDLSAMINAIVAEATRSATNVSANSTFLEEGSKIYQARLNTENWSGELRAFGLDSTTGEVTDSNAPLWHASERMPSPEDRNVFLGRPQAGTGVRFNWDSLSAAERTALNNDSDLVDYLVGDHSKEVRNGGAFRNRSSSLGDIVNSTPAYAGQRDFQFMRLPGVEGNSYRQWRRSEAYRNRTGMVYVGANDGMLHAFNAKSGVEEFAFIPGAVLENLPHLADVNYAHRYYVDGSPTVIDAYLGGEWRTVLLGSTGAGGRSVFALDITNPTQFSAADVFWEFTDAADDELGFTMSRPTVIRLPNGQWAAAFGNGYNSASHGSSLFLVDLASGGLITRVELGTGDADRPNGLGTIFPADLDGDRITDRIYAGDLHGKLWRISLDMEVSDDGNSDPKLVADPHLLLEALDSDGNPQPITARPEVSGHPEPGTVMVSVGTGKFFELDDLSGDSALQVQTFYSIKDHGDVTAGTALTRDDLLQQSILGEDTTTLNGVAVRYRRTSANSYRDEDPQPGWYMDLVFGEPEGERVLSSAAVQAGRLRFTTFIPSDDPCRGGGRNWLIILDMQNGHALSGALPNVDLSLGGIALPDGSPIPTPQPVRTAPGQGLLIPDPEKDPVEINLERDPATLGRQSWRELREREH